ncbi:MAG TPA: phasin family protein [Methyloceanibacter sp.]|jgi:hypothetical protein
MAERNSGKSKKAHKEKAEKVNLREAADALKAAEQQAEKKKVSLSSAAKTSEYEAEVIYAPEPMPVPEPIKQAAPEPAHQSRAPVTTAKIESDDAAESFKQLLSAAQKGASAVNAKLLDMAQEAMNSSLEHARDLTGITNPMQALKLQMKHWHETIESFTAHSQELRNLTTELVATTSEPIRAHLRRPHK